jgi:hypothetical protein
MRRARVVLSMLMAIAIAVLPAIGGAVSVVKAVESATTAMAASDDCCEQGGMPGDPKDHHGAMDDCASLAACAAKCFNYAGVSAGEVTYVEIAVATLTVAPSPALVSFTDPPPFPPPRS